jgi:signal transduction histidine kinase
VNLTDRRTITRPWLQLPRRTVRLRLTLLCSLLFLVAGAGLLAITYLLVRSAPNGQVDKSLLLSPVIPGQPLSNPPPTRAQKQAAFKAQALATHAIDMHELLTRSGTALVVMAVLAVALGWLVVGRMLRPLRAMTAATQRISEHNLHERLALPGPGDEIKDLADTIDGLLHRLEAAFDAQRRFVANASHELRTPLTLNRALLEVTLTNPDATIGDLRTMGQELIASGEQQEQLIEALLTLAASARGLDQLERFDLSEITADVLLGPHPEIDQLGLDVQTTITPAPATGDPRLAKRLVTNLVDNALRHNATGGHINIATRTESRHAILAITNSGPIIPPDDIDRLFQPFQRLHSDRANHPGGHGLGLSIVQSIAAAHSATLTARTRPGGGLHVEVRFPPPVPSNPRYARARHIGPDLQRARSGPRGRRSPKKLDRPGAVWGGDQNELLHRAFESSDAGHPGPAGLAEVLTRETEAGEERRHGLQVVDD